MRTALLLVAGLAGCGVASPSAPPAPAPGPLILKDDGFGVGGTAMEIGFGRTQDGAVQAASRLIGQKPAGIDTHSACQFVRWATGPTMVFRNRAFVGWIADGRVAGDTCGRAPR